MIVVSDLTEKVAKLFGSRYSTQHVLMCWRGLLQQRRRGSVCSKYLYICVENVPGQLQKGEIVHGATPTRRRMQILFRQQGMEAYQIAKRREKALTTNITFLRWPP